MRTQGEKGLAEKDAEGGNGAVGTRTSSTTTLRTKEKSSFYFARPRACCKQPTMRLNARRDCALWDGTERNGISRRRRDASSVSRMLRILVEFFLLCETARAGKTSIALLRNPSRRHHDSFLELHCFFHREFLGFAFLPVCLKCSREKEPVFANRTPGRGAERGRT